MTGTRSFGVSGAAIVVALLLRSAGASAQSPEAARESFEQGIAAMRQGRSADAVSAFSISYRLRPMPVVLYNLGLAHRAAGNRREAWIAFARYVNTASSADPERLAAVRTEMDSLRAQMGLLRFVDPPPGAEISVDEHAVSLGSADIMVDPGPHEVTATAQGYLRGRFHVQVQRGESTSVSLRLEREGATASTSEGTARRVLMQTVEPTPSRRGWVVPVVIVSVLAVAAGVTLGVYFATQSGIEAPPSTTGWTVQSVASW